MKLKYLNNRKFKRHFRSGIYFDKFKDGAFGTNIYQFGFYGYIFTLFL